MKKSKKILLSIAIFWLFIASIIYKAPAWLVGSLASKYSQHYLTTRNETGTFWNGSALLVASDEKGKKFVPLLRINWKIKLGLTKFITLDITSSGHSVASISLVKTGLDVQNVDLNLGMDQLVAFAGNLSTLNLSGSVHVTAANLHLGKTNNGILNASLDSIGSGMSPINPIGNYSINLDLSNMGIDVSSNSGSVINVTGTGNINGLALNAKVSDDKREQMLQFMTMMGLPQADGSYLLKVF